jgi:hypothetical protein
MFERTLRLYACKFLANSSTGNLLILGLRLAAISEVAHRSRRASNPHTSLCIDRISESQR